jgi:hypothetical protein
MRKILLALLVISIIDLSQSARASALKPPSGNDVYPGCKARAEQNTHSLQLTIGGSFCAGLIHGLLYAGNSFGGQERFCVPRGVGTTQLARVVFRFLEEHPERMHEEFGHLGLEALQQAWPC